MKCEMGLPRRPLRGRGAFSLIRLLVSKKRQRTARTPGRYRADECGAAKRSLPVSVRLPGNDYLEDHQAKGFNATRGVIARLNGYCTTNHVTPCAGTYTGN